MDADEAYAECERITWEQARNFAYGIRLLPPPKRRALAAVYAFARRIDDIGDGDLPAAAKSAALEQAREQVHALVAAAGQSPGGGTRQGGLPARGMLPDPRASMPGRHDAPAGALRSSLDSSDPVLVALADSGRRFAVPLAAFGELIDGCLADVNQASYATFDDLYYYCRCVAGSIGRLSLGIYQGGQPSGPLAPGAQARMADDLGIALQITNILRDVREDFGNGRVYLPAEDLAKFGCELTAGEPAPFDDPAWQARFASLVEFEAARAREWYASGMRLLATIDWRSAACTAAMAGIYRRLLEQIASKPSAVLRGRMSLSGKEKALVALRALAGVDRWGSRGTGADAEAVAGGKGAAA